MSFPNVRPSDRAPLVGVIAPQSLAPGSASTGWVDMSTLGSVLVNLLVGAITTGGAVDAKLEQATDAAGANAKDITGKAITQLTAAGGDSNTQVDLNLRSEELDINGGFRYARLTVTTATAAALIAASIRGFDARYQPQADLSSVVEVVG